MLMIRLILSKSCVEITSVDKIEAKKGEYGGDQTEHAQLDSINVDFFLNFIG